MQVAWLERDHFLLHRRIVFSALPPVTIEEGLSQACFARALFCLEGSASDLITSTGPTSSYHHLRGWNFSIWMTPEALRMLSTGTEEPTPAPYPERLRACAVQGLNEDPLLFEVFFICQWFLSISSILKIYFHICHYNPICLLFPLWKLCFILLFQ